MPERRLLLTVELLLDFESDGLAGHLEQVDGFTQRLPFQTDAVDSQDPIAHVNSPCPGHTRKKTKNAQSRTHAAKVRRNSVNFRCSNVDINMHF